jgi:hypothetical protein
MSKRMVPYVVRPGDYLIKLAHRLGFDVGGLDPPSETSGIKHRLQNLGLYLAGERSSADEAQALANAITVFQIRQGLAVTGALDDDTRKALLDEHRT